MKPVIAIEPFNRALFDELVPLGLKCWAESTTLKKDTCVFYSEREFEIEPDFEQYQLISDRGMLTIFTLRDEGVLKGYIVGIMYRALHHKKVLGCIADTAYAEPDYHVYMPVLVERFEKEYAAKGAGLVGWPTTLGGPIYELLKARGYVGDDIVMEKKLCA